MDSGEVSGDKNAPSSDDTEEDLVCLPVKGPLTVTPEPSPLEVKNTSVSESESVFSGNSFPLLSMKRLGCRGPPSARIQGWDLTLGRNDPGYIFKDQGQRTSFSPWYEVGLLPQAGMIQGMYLKIRGRGPPSALGMRSGCYLRPE